MRRERQRGTAAADRRLPSAVVLGWVGVSTALALSFLLVALRAHGDMSILGDEWHYAYWTSTDGALSKGFDPASGRYALPIPLAIYQGLFEVFGADSYVPFRVMMAIFLILVTGLAYEFMRRRLGYGLALPLAALIPLFGAAGEVVVNSFRMPGMISLAAALGAILLLERRSRGRDIGAGALLVVAVASHPLGLAFVAAAGAICLRTFVEGKNRLASLAVVGAPGLAFLAVLRPSDPKTEPLSDRLSELPGFTIDGAQGLMNALGGLVSDVLPFESLTGFRSPIGTIALVALVLVVAYSVWRRRLDSLTFLALLGAALIILAAPVFAPGDRPPNLGRYVFPAGVCVLLALADIGRDVPGWLRRGGTGRPAAYAAIGIVAAMSLVGNTEQLDNLAQRFASDSRHVRAEAAALEAVRDQSPKPKVKIERDNTQVLGGKFRFSIEVAEYYVMRDDYGTTAWTPEELAEQEPDVQRTFDLSKQIALGKLK